MINLNQIEWEPASPEAPPTKRLQHNAVPALPPVRTDWLITMVYDESPVYLNHLIARLKPYFDLAVTSFASEEQLSSLTAVLNARVAYFIINLHGQFKKDVIIQYSTNAVCIKY